MSVTVFVPRDSVALGLGAEAVVSAIVAEAARRSLSLELVRNGSRGLFWLEPLVEVVENGRRYAFGPVAPGDVPGLFVAGFPKPVKHPLFLGPTEEIPFLKNQERLAFARIGLADPLSLGAYRSHGGLAGLFAALEMAPTAVLDAVAQSGLRGRGGAAFPAGIKWRTVANAGGPQKYVVCNADEGDSGTFSDRLIMESDPYQLIEGMLIAGLAVGASQGYIYLRSEYPHALKTMAAAIDQAGAEKLLGENILGSGKAFHLHLRKAAGSYVCGEETALLESLEGRRGIVRAKPPLPALQGLFGAPTLVNNVVTLASVPFILASGAAAYQDYGVAASRGTLAFQLAGNIKQGGLVEKAFGLSLRELLYDYGGGSRSGRPIRAVQVGGPLGAYLPESQFDTPLDYEAFAKIGATVGHGGIVVFDDRVDMARQARYAMAFCRQESCGKCTPCRIGAVRGVEVMDRIIAGDNVAPNIELLRDLCDVMVAGSLCAMGGMTPNPVLSALNHFPADFSREPAQ